MGLDRHAHLHDAPAENDNAQRLDDAKNKIGKVIHNIQRIAARRHRGRNAAKAEDGSTSRRPVTPLPLVRLHHAVVLLLSLIHI